MTTQEATAFVRGRTTETVIRDLATREMDAAHLQLVIAALVARYDAKAARRAAKEA